MPSPERAPSPVDEFAVKVPLIAVAVPAEEM